MFVQDGLILRLTTWVCGLALSLLTGQGGGELGPQRRWLPAVKAAGGDTLWVAGSLFNSKPALPVVTRQVKSFNVYKRFVPVRCFEPG